MAIDFPSAPTDGQEHTSGGVTYVYNGTGWVMKTTPAVPAAPFDAMAYNGMQINGGMEVSQEKGTTGTTVNPGTNFILDGWSVYLSGTVPLGANQNASVPNSGFGACLGLLATTAASTGANDFVFTQQSIEGHRWRRLQYGTAAAQPVTIAFWVSANSAGTFGLSLRNKIFSHSYVALVTVLAANTWEYKTVTIPGATVGTWSADNTTGVVISFCSLCLAASIMTPTPNAWLSGNFVAVNGQQTNFLTASKGFYITGVTILPGTQAPTAAQSPLIMRPYDQELVTCQRYFQWNGGTNDTSFHLFNATNQLGAYKFSTTMRVNPTITLYNGTTANQVTIVGGAGVTPNTIFGITPNGFSSFGTLGTFTGPTQFNVKADARL